MRKDPMAYPSKVNPITTASQYGLMQAIAHGGILRQDFDISPEVAREMIEKTPRRLRSKFAAELAERRYDMRRANAAAEFEKLNSFLGVYNGKVYYYYEDTERIQGVPIKKIGAWGDSDVSYDDRLDWKHASQSRTGDTRVIRVQWAGGTQEFVVYSNDILKTLVEKPKKTKTTKPKSVPTYKGHYYTRISTSFGMRYIAARKLENLREGEEDFNAKTKDVLFHQIDEYGQSNGNPGNRSAESLSEEWHGREPVDVLDYEEREEYESDGAVLAELEELRVILENGEETVNVEFGDMPMLVANVATETLEIVGGDQVLEFGKGWDTSKSEVVVGHVYLIAYKTDKHHLEGSTGKHESYEHFFGEEYYKSRGYKVADYEDSDDFFQDILEDGIVDDAIQECYLPTMVYDTVNSKIKLVGGRYTIEDVGLRD